MKKLRLGFVGTGQMGQCAHLRNYAALPECEVAAIAELRPRLRKLVAERYGIPRAYQEGRDMMENERLDGVVAVQPFQRHGSVLPGLLQYGVPLFSEKPLARSVSCGEKIIEAGRSAGTLHVVGYHKRSDPAVIYAKNEIEKFQENGVLGKLKYVRITMPSGNWTAGGLMGKIATDEARPSLEHDSAEQGIHASMREQFDEFINFYIHQVNLLRHLLGEPCRAGYADPSGVLFSVQGLSGTCGVIELSPYSTALDWQEKALVCFEHGWISIDIPPPLSVNRAGRVEVMRGKKDEKPGCWIPAMPNLDAMRNQAMNFLAVIKGETAPVCRPEDALEDLKISRDYIKMLYKARKKDNKCN